MLIPNASESIPTAGLAPESNLDGPKSPSSSASKTTSRDAGLPSGLKSRSRTGDSARPLHLRMEPLAVIPGIMSDGSKKNDKHGVPYDTMKYVPNSGGQFIANTNSTTLTGFKKGAEFWVHDHSSLSDKPVAKLSVVTVGEEKIATDYIRTFGGVSSSQQGGASQTSNAARRLLQSRPRDIRMDRRLSRIVNGHASPAECTIDWLRADQRDPAIDQIVGGLRIWNPDFEPKTESDGEDDETMSRIDTSDPTHRLQRTYDIAGVMRNEDPEAAYIASCQSNGHILGIISIEPGNPPHVGDLLTHPGTSSVGRNLLRFASEYSQQWNSGGVFQLDAGDEAACVRYESMGLRHIGPGFLMRYEPPTQR